MNSDRGPINGDSFRCNVWIPAVEASGLPPHRQPHIHDLRHTHASWLLDAGLSLPAIQKRLGHADVMTTLAMYGHPATDTKTRSWRRSKGCKGPEAKRGSRCTLSSAVRYRLRHRRLGGCAGNDGAAFDDCLDVGVTEAERPDDPACGEGAVSDAVDQPVLRIAADQLADFRNAVRVRPCGAAHFGCRSTLELLAMVTSPGVAGMSSVAPRDQYR